MNPNDNPYATPIDTQHGKYEWPLWRRILYACSAIAIVYLLCDAALMWQNYDKIASKDEPAVTRLLSFFSDWKAPRNQHASRLD